jgi:hypothetical protein
MNTNYKIASQGSYDLGAYYGTLLGVKRFASHNYYGDITIYKDTGKNYADSGEPVYESVCQKVGGRWFENVGNPLF